METLTALLESAQLPVLSAFILGLMTAISPCPLATNITAIAYISKNFAHKKQVFLSGVFYTLGRAFSYTAIGVILYFGASKFQVARFLQQNGEKFLGPLLIIIGLILLGAINLRLPGMSGFQQRITDKLEGKGYFGTFLIGVIFALAFCPYSGALYFGMLIPMTIASIKGLYLPLVFAIGTGLPVIIFAWLLAFSIGSVSKFHVGIQKIEKVMRFVAGSVFIVTGIYYVSIFFFNS